MSIVKRLASAALVAVLSASIALAQVIQIPLFNPAVPIPAANIYIPPPTPTLVQHVSWVGNGNSETGNAFVLRLPNPTGANNLLLLDLLYPSSVTSVSITDNATGGTNTWPTTPTVTVTDSGNAMKDGVFILPGAFGGVTAITVTLNAAKNGFKPTFQEWYNVATTSPTDGSASALATTSSVSSGSFNTTTNGDLILHFAGCTDNGSGGLDGSIDGFSKVVKATGYTLSQVDLTDGYFSEYQIQSTAGATNPAATITVTAGSFTFPSMTLALKAATAGTAPTATPRVFGMLHSRIIGTGATGNVSYPWQFPTHGNTLVSDFSDPEAAIALVSISGATSGSWTTVTTSGQEAQAAYKTSATASTDEMLTVTLNDAIDHVYIQGITYDIVGGGSFDQSVSTVGSTTFGPGNSTPAVSLTPGVTSGIVVAVFGLNTGPPDSVVTPSCATFLSVTYTGETDLSYMDNGDFHAICYYSSNAAQSWVFHNTASTSGFGTTLVSIQ
jgi:hypothetical protein